MNRVSIHGFQIKQFSDKLAVNCNIPFNILEEIVLLSYRIPLEFDPEAPLKKATEVLAELNPDYYQRKWDDPRVNRIKAFLRRGLDDLVDRGIDRLVLFPTSIILSGKIEDSNENYLMQSSITNVATTLRAEDVHLIPGVLYEIQENYVKLEIPRFSNMFVVDGQHRILALIFLKRDLKKELITLQKNPEFDNYRINQLEEKIRLTNEFTFSTTVLLGFDLWEQGRIFTDVNFNQKPVNKSLYYDIFGSYPDPERNDIFLAHTLALFLNNNNESPLKSFIKMLGTGNGYFSQAFIVEALLKHFRPNGVWSFIPDDFRKNGTKHKFLSGFLKIYFETIKRILYKYWPIEGQVYNDVLCKTTGMGAIIKLLHPFSNYLLKTYERIDVNDEILTLEVNKVFSAIEPNGEELFSSNGKYARAGSLGLQSALYSEMRDLASLSAYE